MAYFGPMGTPSKILSLALLGLFSIGMAGQVNVIIVDQTEQGFFLGVNGWLQNTEKKKSLAIKDLDTIPYYLQIDSDTFHFSKKIHLHEAQNYQFVLTKNYYGQLKLRYRGTLGAIPEQASTQKLDQTIKWPKGWTPPVEDEQDLIVVNDNPKDGIPEEPAVAVVAVTTDDQPNETVELTTTPAPEETVNEEPEVPVETFETFITGVKSEEFEFEKLNSSLNWAKNHDMTVEELAMVSKALKYDQTRLQFFNEAGKYIKTREDVVLLSKTLEYELSKQQLQKIKLNE